MPFSGVTNSTTIPIRQVHLSITFGSRNNYRTELIDFDVAHIGIPYNVILGYLALAKFTAATHHAYNMLNMPGRSGGVIMVRCDEVKALRSLEHTYKTVAATYPKDLMPWTML